MEFLKLQMTDFCQHCKTIQDVKGTVKNREEEGGDGKKKNIVVLTYHCEVCHNFIRSEEHELEKQKTDPT